MQYNKPLSNVHGLLAVGQFAVTVLESLPKTMQLG